MASFPIDILAGAVSKVMPFLCPVCGKNPPFDGSPNMFCAECMKDMPFINGKVCRACGGELTGIFDVCTDCMNVPPRPWRNAKALFSYRGKVEDAVHLFKYCGRTELARPFAGLAAGLIDDPSGYSAIVPVPLHWRRFLERGYNQSELFAKGLSALTGIPVVPLLRRIRNTEHQAFMDKTERNENIAGAFSISDSKVSGSGGILLTDDVMTTGATLAEAATVLKTAGFANVDVLVIARRQRN